jgi:hypothetical protein
VGGTVDASAGAARNDFEWLKARTSIKLAN